MMTLKRKKYTLRRFADDAFTYTTLIIVSLIFVFPCLWLVLASFSKPSYISVVVCFAVFLINDTYGFICWQKMKKRQLLNN